MTNRQNSTKRLLVWGIGLLVPAAIVVGLVVAAAPPQQSPDEVQRRILPVEVIEIEPVEQYEVRRTYTGVVDSARTSEIGFERAGRLLHVVVDEGDEVYEGQQLARLDERHLQAQKVQLQAERQQAAALLDEFIAGPRQQTIAAARADVADFQSQSLHAEAVHRRSEDLKRKQVISKEDYDASAFGVRSAKARLESAQKKLDELLAGTRKERIAAQRAAVARLDAALADLEIDLQDTILVAPYAGRIGKRFVDEGTIIAPQTPILRLVERGKLEVRIGLPVGVAKTVQPGSKETLLIGGKPYPADVKTVLPELEMSTRTRTVVLRLSTEAAEVLVPGEVARMEVTGTVASKGYWLPTSALSRGRRGMWSVMAVARDSGSELAEQRDVEILHTEGEQVLVRGTLQDNDRVISGGSHRIVDGQAVTVVANPDGAASPR